MTHNYWLHQLAQRWFRRGRAQHRSWRRASAQTCRRTTLLLEVLEDRVAPAVFNVTTTADTHAVNLTTGVDANGQISLRSALEAANHLGGNNTINLSDNTYKLTLSGNLTINNDLTIAGVTGTEIDGGNLDRIFTVSAGQVVTISDVSLQNGLSSTQGGGIYNSGNLTLLNDSLSSVKVQGSTGSDAEGGGIFNAPSGVLKLINTNVDG